MSIQWKHQRAIFDAHSRAVSMLNLGRVNILEFGHEGSAGLGSVIGIQRGK
jgi:hypothetical protein